MRREAAEIEREENIRRKELTQFELDKELVRRAEQIGPIISARGAEIDPRGRKRVYDAPKSDIAAALEVGVSTLVRAEKIAPVLPSAMDGKTPRGEIMRGGEKTLV